MNEHLDKALCEAFPNLYRDRNAPMTETCMCWGFPGDGWFLIIWHLSEKLEKIILRESEESRHLICARQVKEKFGGLRFYMSLHSDKIGAAISKAEAEALETCEKCGRPGSSDNSKGSWIQVLCEVCGEVN